jgi:hypothetical protein
MTTPAPLLCFLDRVSLNLGLPILFRHYSGSWVSNVAMASIVAMTIEVEW